MKTSIYVYFKCVALVIGAANGWDTRRPSSRMQDAECVVDRVRHLDIVCRFCICNFIVPNGGGEEDGFVRL